MLESAECSGGTHLAPRAGGSCPCGMVTRIPAPVPPAAGHPPELRALLAECLGTGPGAVVAASSGPPLAEQADRLLAALTTAGLVLREGAADQRSA